MKITVSREAGWFGRSASLKLTALDTEVASISNGETIDLHINAAEDQEVFLSVGFLNKTKIQVQDGDKIRIELNPLLNPCLIGMIACLFLNFVSIFSIFIAVPLSLTLTFMKQYKLTKIA